MARQRQLNEEQILQLLLENESDEDLDVVNGPELCLEANDEVGSEIRYIERKETIDSSDSDDDTNVCVQRRKKVLPRNRLVCSLDESLNETNYDAIDIPIDGDTYNVVLTKGTKSIPANNITWSEKTPQQGGRQCSENIIRTKGGPINDGEIACSEYDTWKKFMTTEMLQSLVTFSNIQIHKIISKIDLEQVSKCNQRHLNPTTGEELTAFIGLLYARAMLNLSHHNAKYLFETAIGHPIFGATMSGKRFRFLLAHIRFDDSQTRRDRFIHDRFAAARDLFEDFNNRCSSVLQPDEYIAIDETLYGCRNQISFKQYNSSKPQKYGLLFKSINSVKYPFTFRAVVYSGKPTGDPGPYYIPDIMPIVKNLGQ